MDGADVSAVFLATPECASDRRSGCAHGDPAGLQKAPDADAQAGGADRQMLAPVLQFCCLVPVAAPGADKSRIHRGGTETGRKATSEIPTLSLPKGRDPYSPEKDRIDIADW